jgi:hypothetical protein
MGLSGPALPVTVVRRPALRPDRSTCHGAEGETDGSGQAVVRGREAHEQVKLCRQHVDLAGNADQGGDGELLDGDDEGQDEAGEQRIAEQGQRHAPDHCARPRTGCSCRLLIDAVHAHDRSAHREVDERHLVQHHDKDDARRRVDVDAQPGQAQGVVDDRVDDPAGRADDDPGHRQDERGEVKGQYDEGGDQVAVLEVGAMHEQRDGGPDHDAQGRGEEAYPERRADRADHAH